MDAMKFGEKLQRLRKEKGMSQEMLAEALGVSRQAISKWESGQSWPETDKLIALSELFGVSLDSLMKNGDPPPNGNGANSQPPPHEGAYAQPPPYGGYRQGFPYHMFSYEYKSSRTLFGLPLVHVNIGFGVKRAKGILAIGTIATGFVSLGLVSVGLLSLGILSLGLLAFGSFSVGLLLAAGAVAIGTVAIGAIALGVFSLDALSVGMYSVGALSVASNIAIGDRATGHIAVGTSSADGVRAFLSDPTNNSFQFHGIGADAVRQAIREEFPGTWEWIVRLMTSFI
ncbi:MAG: helix-turn-helix domain-containing protein [Oscillospiraceae bacterium]|jgi:transcriptional regulator with XRE-family HTH domain|nr:helix-turn-helix domain-containing protein [Oscillospiraceae bacterium]